MLNNTAMTIIMVIIFVFLLAVLMCCGSLTGICSVCQDAVEGIREARAERMVARSLVHAEEGEIFTVDGIPLCWIQPCLQPTIIIWHIIPLQPLTPPPSPHIPPTIHHFNSYSSLLPLDPRGLQYLHMQLSTISVASNSELSEGGWGVFGMNWGQFRFKVGGRW
jgi:hypothetical protein